MKNINVLCSTFTNVFYFSHVFYVFNVFYLFFWNVFYIYAQNDGGRNAAIAINSVVGVEIYKSLLLCNSIPCKSRRNETTPTDRLSGAHTAIYLIARTRRKRSTNIARGKQNTRSTVIFFTAAHRPTGPDPWPRTILPQPPAVGRSAHIISHKCYCYRSDVTINTTDPRQTGRERDGTRYYIRRCRTAGFIGRRQIGILLRLINGA